VRITDRDARETEEYDIVGSGEGDPAAGRISHDSPIGNALLGHHEGDVVEIETPGGVRRLKILRVATASSATLRDGVAGLPGKRGRDALVRRSWRILRARLRPLLRQRPTLQGCSHGVGRPGVLPHRVGLTLWTTPGPHQHGI
jgi:hypothetical protein